MGNWKYQKLSDCASYVSERTSDITFENYITTENMIENRGGVKIASSLPDAKSTSAYKPNDILLSNIRPYFCKIWLADKKGSCSNDVLVVRAKNNIDSKFLYYVLSDQNFFNYDTMTSKGTKMPRGTQSAIMKYGVPDLSLPTQRRIASILSTYDALIQNYKRQIAALQSAASELYKEWFVRFRFPGYKSAKFDNGLPVGWKVEKLGELGIISAGGDKPSVFSEVKTDICKIPIFSNGIENDGLYGYTDKPAINKESVTVSARGTVGFVCFRGEPYLPIVRLLSITPKDTHLTAKYLFYYLKDAHLDGNGTSQQQITIPMIAKKKIVVPNENVLNAFEKIITPIFEQIKNANLQITNLTTQRDLLLPRLMSGKLSVE